MFAGLTLMLICGAVGLAIDIGVWYRTARAMQNAADAAVVAAARDGTGGAWNGTGQAIAARYGFVDGADDIQVQITKDQICPNGATNCFKATIEQAAPQFFSKVLDIPAPRLSVSATASLTAGAALRQYCILALATSGANPAIRTNGAPFADLGNCNVMSNTDMTCNGHTLNATFADAAGINNGCGPGSNGVPRATDPFAGLATNIPRTGAVGSAAVASSSTGFGQPPWSGALGLASMPVLSIVGDLVLNGDTTVTTPATGTVVYIRNGTLNLNGHRLRTAPGSGLTLVFTGTTSGNSTSPRPYPTGGGTLNIEAPKTGAWAGVAIYIDPRTTGPQNITYHGNSPTWKITGLVYMPHASFTVSGAVSKSSSGGACFALVIDNLLINGTASILVRPEDCPDAGVTLPRNLLPNGSPALVL